MLNNLQIHIKHRLSQQPRVFVLNCIQRVAITILQEMMIFFIFPIGFQFFNK